MSGGDVTLATVAAASPHPLDDHAAFRQRRHFGSLDGLRAISVIAVIWHHTMGHSFDSSLLTRGYHGVTLFFAISGFLIVTLLLREQDTTGRINLRAFYMRRSLRIFPLYYAVLGIYVVSVLVLEADSRVGREFMRNLPFFATYTSNWFVPLDGRVIFYFAWSLAAEEQFYLMWPSVQRFFSTKRLLVFLAALIVLLATLSVVGPPANADNPVWYRILTSIPLAICFGVALAYLLHHERSFRALRWLFGWRFSSVVFAALALGALGYGDSVLAIHLAMALLVGACVFREDHVIGPVLRWAPLAFMGSISYGMYLLHMLVKNAVGMALSSAGIAHPRYVIFVLTLAGTVFVAWISFRYFESFFLSRKARYAVTA